MAFSSTINTVHAVIRRHCCETMILQFNYCGLSYGTSRLLYCDRAIPDSVLFLAGAWQEWDSDMIEMNGGRGPMANLDIKLWPLNLFYS